MHAQYIPQLQRPSNTLFQLSTFLFSPLPLSWPKWYSFNPREFLAGTRMRVPKFAAFPSFLCHVRPSSKLSNKPRPVGARSRSTLKVNLARRDERIPEDARGSIPDLPGPTPSSYHSPPSRSPTRARELFILASPGRHISLRSSRISAWRAEKLPPVFHQIFQLSFPTSERLELCGAFLELRSRPLSR